MAPLTQLLSALPKVELHIHIEGSLEPALMFKLARQNGISLPFRSEEEICKAYKFNDLQSFLDIYYQGTNVLIKEQDFYDLTWEYMNRAAQENVRHVEMFFDPQTHTDRNIPFKTVITGIIRALTDARVKLGVTSKLIMCFLRHLSADAAMNILEQSLDYKDSIIAVGLDSSEHGNPPEKFAAVFERAQQEGFLTVAHAGEEGPSEYIWQAIRKLNVSRIDHGVRCIEDVKLVEHLRITRLPLTVCPLSNVKLKVFPDLQSHNLNELLELDLCVSIHSDDPAYFGGYITENYLASQQALDLDIEAIHRLSSNAIEASFLNDEQKRQLQSELDSYIASY